MLDLRKLILISSSALFSVVCCSAYSEDSKQEKNSDAEYRLVDCIRFALGKNYDLKSNRMDFLKAKHLQREYKSAYYPKVSLEASGRLIDENPSLSLPVGAASPLVAEINTDEIIRLNIKLEQAIYTSGRVSNLVKSAKHEYRSRMFSFVQHKRDLTFAIYRMYYDVKRRMVFLEADQEALDYAQKHLDDVQLRDTKKTRKLRAQTSLLNAKARLQKSKQQLVEAENLLKKEMNYNGSFVLTDDLVYSEIEVKEKDEIKKAIDSRPDINSLRAKIRSFYFLKRAEKSNMRPQVVAEIQTGMQSPEFGEFGGEDEFDYHYQGLFKVSLNLFDGFKTKSRVQQLDYDKTALMNRLSGLIAQMKMDIKNIIHQITTSANLVNLQKLSLKLSRENYEITNDGFKAGENTQLELLDSRLQLTLNKKELVNAIYWHEISKVRLWLMTGKINLKSFE